MSTSYTGSHSGSQSGPAENSASVVSSTRCSGRLASRTMPTGVCGWRAAAGDFVVTFYNPRSRDRDWQLGKALALLAAARHPQTPVGIVREASRPEQRVLLTTLAEFSAGPDCDPEYDPEYDVDMRSVVVVGSSTSHVVAGRMVTPRGYRWQS